MESQSFFPPTLSPSYNVSLDDKTLLVIPKLSFVYLNKKDMS